MNNHIKHGLMIAALACGLGGVSAAETPPSAETFFQTSTFGGAELSPNGQLLAVRIGGKNSRIRLAVVDLRTMKSEVVASFAEPDVGKIRWVNDRRLVFDLTDLQVAQGDIDAAPGLFAVNADGGEFRQLVERVRFRLKAAHGQELLPWNTFLHDGIGAQDSDEVFVVKPLELSDKKVDHLVLQRLNTRTGRVEDVDSPPHSVAWIVDGKGELRVAVTRDDKVGAIHVRDVASGTWAKLVEYDPYLGQHMTPRFMDPAGRLYVETRNGQDKVAIYTFDLTARKLDGNPVLISDKFDLSAQYVATQQKLLGLRYTVDAEVPHWLDPELQAIQAAVDKALPTTVNRIAVPLRSEGKFLLINAYSDVLPGIYFLYDTQERKLLKVGSARPDIDPKSMSRMDMVRYPARDGLEIPAYLTLPRGAAKKGLPLVVLVHGGPYLRGGHWGWNPEVQFLASRGYAVLQPEFRGSMGFGDRHFKAGWKQWDLDMQNDIADGVQWAIAQGIADPRRICIAGASYGGYAVLMGLARDAALYRCGVNWVGVTDINLMYSVDWSDVSDAWKLHGMPRLVGDPVKDAAQLKATSPIENAARIRAPLLMAYGDKDMRVPIVHGEKFRDAVKIHNPAVEWVVYDREGHGWRKLETRIDFWTRVERFLERNIGKPSGGT